MPREGGARIAAFSIQFPAQPVNVQGIAGRADREVARGSRLARPDAGHRRVDGAQLRPLGPHSVVAGAPSQGIEIPPHPRG